MRDPFDTGPVFRLGDSYATIVDKSEDMPLKEFEERLPKASSFGITPAAPDRLQVDVSNLTIVEIASLVGNVRHETHPKHRPHLDLFTAAFGPRTLPTEKDFIEDFDRYAYADAFVGIKWPRDVCPETIEEIIEKRIKTHLPIGVTTEEFRIALRANYEAVKERYYALAKKADPN